MDNDPSLAIVIGHLEERDAGASRYNRLCALDWKTPAGEITNSLSLLGVMLVRVSVFLEVGGFNAQIIVAGEDTDFGRRVLLAGHRAAKIDARMAFHDAVSVGPAKSRQPA